MDRKRLKQLIKEYRAGVLEPQDAEELRYYMADERYDHDIREVVDDFSLESGYATDQQYNSEAVFLKIDRQIQMQRKRTVFKMLRICGAATAACLILFMVFGDGRKWTTALFSRNTQPNVIKTVTTAPTDRPIIVLSDGRTLNLDSLGDGKIASEGGVSVSLTADNELIYALDKQTTVTGESKINTIVIPKGQQYTISMSDGTRVFLNTASKISYPVVFGSGRREVDLDGEAFFEVKKSTAWPFVVQTKYQTIEVLGTDFNVSAYSDDIYTKTTLVEGSVKVSAHQGGVVKQTTILTPNQQAITSSKRTDMNVRRVNASDVSAWKDDLFVFEDEELIEIMKKISRWYDIEVEYRDGMQGKKIGGVIPKLDRIDEIMLLLKETGLLKYEKKGGKIIVME